MHRRGDGYGHKGWCIVNDGELWLMWPPGAADVSRSVRAAVTRDQAKDHTERADVARAKLDQILRPQG
jgi:hypothetical protein